MGFEIWELFNLQKGKSEVLTLRNCLWKSQESLGQGVGKSM